MDSTRIHSPRRAFTLTDLLFGILLIALALFFSLAATSGLDSPNTRVRCASNLRMIGQAILLYCNDNKGPYPRTNYVPDRADNPTAYTGSGMTDPFAPSSPQVNDVSAALYLLLRTEDITSPVFVCPATSLHPDDFGGGIHTALDNANFPSGQNLSYSYADPYPSRQAASVGYDLRMSSSMDPTFAVAADMNPGSSQLTTITPASSDADMRKGNSPNHSTDGQNVLYADGHVEFQNNPFCGVNRDNIYTFGQSGEGNSTSVGAGIFGSPVGPSDSVLLPAADMSAMTSPVPAPVSPPVAAAPLPSTDQGVDLTVYAAIAASFFLLILLAAVAFAILRKRKVPGTDT